MNSYNKIIETIIKNNKILYPIKWLKIKEFIVVILVKENYYNSKK